MRLLGIYFGAIRNDDAFNREWLDTKTIGTFRETAIELADIADGECGHRWATDNPVVRIARIIIEEDPS